jgi:hypothetical protein
MKMEQSVPKRRHIKFRRRGITQKKTYKDCITYIGQHMLGVVQVICFVLLMRLLRKVAEIRPFDFHSLFFLDV